MASHPLFFEWAIAIVTAYLGVALLLGLGTRIACFVGSFFSAVLLATQFGSTFFFPGGTDVGEHPLYILAYAVMIVGGAGTSLSLDVWLRDTLAARRRAQPTVVRRPAPRPLWSAALPVRTVFIYFTAGTLISLAVGFGLVIAIPAPAATNGSTPTGPVSYVNLSINIDPQNGWPQVLPGELLRSGGARGIYDRGQRLPHQLERMSVSRGWYGRRGGVHQRHPGGTRLVGQRGPHVQHSRARPPDPEPRAEHGPVHGRCDQPRRVHLVLLRPVRDRRRPVHHPADGRGRVHDRYDDGHLTRGGGFPETTPGSERGDGPDRTGRTERC